jgi:hypothetical protein
LHSEIAAAMEVAAPLAWESPSHLYAVAYRRTLFRGQPRVEAWPKRITLGVQLPTLPLWIDLDVCLPLHLEASYETACHSLRVAF